MNILVGCPLSDRMWILPLWFDHVEAAFSKAGLTPGYVFVVGNEDEETIDFLSSRDDTYIKIIQESKREDFRRWNHSRYEYMSFLRNELLKVVRSQAPDYFLSLDSDILLHEDALVSAFDALDQHDSAWAVGLKCYMSTDSRVHPSMGNWINGSYGRFYRTDASDMAAVDIIMAAKLMKPQAYSVDYKWHGSGEDLGWSVAVRESGGKFVWDGRVANKHVMSKNLVNVVDKRIGF